jgi:Zn-dependent protease
MTLPEPEILHAIVARVFRAEDMTLGDPQKNYIVRYRGRLLSDDSEAAYDQLTEYLKPYGVLPLFRIEDEMQVVYLITGLPQRKASNKNVNLVLFGLTFISVLITGAMYSYEGTAPEGLAATLLVLFKNLWAGWPFAVSMLGILAAHEFGHYLVGRYHRSDVTLPYFIPLPFSLLGTMGAFIQMKSPPRNRRALLDIGIAGPLAGLVVAIPVLLLGLSLSETGPIQGQGLLEGNSILYLLAKYAVFGKLLPEPLNYDGLPVALYWLRYVFTGMPIPMGGLDVQLHPVAWAGWAGLLVTAMNLIPAGQLDGGHILYVLLGKRVRKIFPFLLAAVALMGLVWNGWLLWAFLLFIFGRVNAEPLDQITPLDTGRKVIAVLMLVLFLLVFIPVPLVTFG